MGRRFVASILDYRTKSEASDAARVAATAFKFWRMELMESAKLAAEALTDGLKDANRDALEKKLGELVSASDALYGLAIDPLPGSISGLPADAVISAWKPDGMGRLDHGIDVPAITGIRNDWEPVMNGSAGVHWRDGALAWSPGNDSGVYLCAVPMRDKGRVTGVLIAAASKGWLLRQTQLMRTFFPSGECFFLVEGGADGQAPGMRIFGPPVTSSEAGVARLAQAGIAGAERVPAMAGTQGGGWLAYESVPETRWATAAFFPTDNTDYVLSGFEKTVMYAGLAMIPILIALSWFAARSLARPIRALERCVDNTAKGDFDSQMELESGGVEITRLSAGLAAMRHSIREFIRDFRRYTAVRQRQESDNAIAREIQRSITPATLPRSPFFDLGAGLFPALESGGDFYDYWPLGDECMVLVIGDVSEKGVPAAVAMSTCCACLKACSRELLSPETMLARLNEQLTQGNDQYIFVSLFLTIIHLPSGHCLYASGGHESPFILNSAGEVKAVPRVNGMLLGVKPDAEYAAGELLLAEGDSLFIYTDGATEVTNAMYEQFGEERAMAALRSLHGRSSAELVEGLHREVEIFSDGVERRDDYALLCFRYLGESGSV